MSVYSPGQTVTISLTGLANGGEAVGRLGELVVFVPYGAPQDECEICLTDVKKNYARGEIQKITKESPLRQVPLCPVYYRCGGCQLQHLKYSSQIALKEQSVRETLHHLGGLENISVNSMVSAESPWNYRNKMQVVAGCENFSDTEFGGIYFGLYAPKTHELVPMDNCAIQHPLTNKILGEIKDILGPFGWSVHDEKTGRGLLRHLLIRVSQSRKRAMLVLISAGRNLPKLSQFVDRVVERIPSIESIALNINNKKTNTVLGAKTYMLWGTDTITEEIGGIKYLISPNSFFQVNTTQTERLFDLMEKYAAPGENDVILDAYCGVGAMGLRLASKAGRVIGIEEVPQAKNDALKNAALNNIENFDFYTGRVEILLPDLCKKGVNFTKAVIDPPRKGCDASFLNLLAETGVKGIVYVSCNPATLARDLSILSSLGYRIDEVTPVDMFPQTHHVECVAKLTFTNALISRISRATQGDIPSQSETGGKISEENNIISGTGKKKSPDSTFPERGQRDKLRSGNRAKKNKYQNNKSGSDN